MLAFNLKVSIRALSTSLIQIVQPKFYFPNQLYLFRAVAGAIGGRGEESLSLPPSLVLLMLLWWLSEYALGVPLTL